MSLETLSIMESHRKYAVEDSPASETFSIVGSETTFKGIFDKSAVDEKEDGGHVLQKNVMASIIVTSLPSGIIERITQIKRENGTDTYTFNFYDVDEMGQGLIWLM